MNFNHFWEKVGEDIGEGGKKGKREEKEKSIILFPVGIESFLLVQRWICREA